MNQRPGKNLFDLATMAISHFNAEDRTRDEAMIASSSTKWTNGQSLLIADKIYLHLSLASSENYFRSELSHIILSLLPRPIQM